MAFQDKSAESIGSQLAVGDVEGHLHVLSLPKNLVKRGPKEMETAGAFFASEEEAVLYFDERKKSLIEMKEQLLKEALLKDDKDEGAVKTSDVEMEQAEASYQAFFAQMQAQLKEEEE